MSEPRACTRRSHRGQRGHRVRAERVAEKREVVCSRALSGVAEIAVSTESQR